MGKKIVDRHRQAAIHRFSEDYFAEENNFGSPLPVQKTWRSAEMPSWWEFVQYIIETDPIKYDEHWKPINMYCSICSFSYNYILHFENMQQEEQMFGLELGKQDKMNNQHENTNHEGLSKEEVVAKYFSLLDDDDILKLY